jgi:hypothetical protein
MCLNERHVTRVYFPSVGVGCKQELRFETLPRSIRSIEGKVNLALVEFASQTGFLHHGTMKPGS